MFKNLLIFILLISTASYSQTEIHRNFTQGYVVLTNGDTLRGNLAQVSEAESCDTVYFKKNIMDAVTGFNAGQLRMYKRDNSVYLSRMISSKKGGLVRVIELGKINLFRYTYEFNKVSLKGIGGSGKPDQSGPVEIEHKERPTDESFDYYIEKTGGECKKLSRGNLRGELWAFFKGDDLMVKKVKDTKMEYEEIPDLIKEYNKQQ